MDPFVLRVFQREILWQCEFVLLAAEQLDEARAEASRANEQMGAFGHKVKAELSALGEDPVADMAEQPARFERRRRARAEISPSHEISKRTWFALQGILVSAANISKLLWGSHERDPQKAAEIAAERAPLRRSVRVTKGSPLYARKLRNAFEHIDAELSTFYKGSARNYIGRTIGPPAMIGGTKAKRFGHYDPNTGVLIFWARSANVRRIVAEVQRIYPLVKAETEKGI